MAMTLAHEIFDVFNAVVAIVALIVLFVDMKNRRRLIGAAVVLLFVGLSILIAYEQVDHLHSMRKVHDQILDELRSGPRTLDELAISLRDVNLSLLREALESAVQGGQVSGEDQTLSQSDGSAKHTVRLYFLPVSR